GELTLEVPGEWTLEGDPGATVDTAIRTARDLKFLAANQDKAPQLFHHVKDDTSVVLAAAYAAIFPRIKRSPLAVLEQLETSCSSDVPGRDAVLTHIRQSVIATDLAELQKSFFATENRQEKRKILDSLCFWPTPAALPVLQSITEETWA